MNREKREQRDARDEALVHARKTGLHIGNDFTGRGGIPMRLTREGYIVPMPEYLEAARNRRRERMGARMEIEHDKTRI